MTADIPPDDPGASSERTLLAWRRTALLIGVASVIGARVLAEALGPATFAFGLLGVAFATAAHGHASARYTQGRIPVRKGTAVIAASSRRLAWMSVATAFLAVTATTVVWHLNR